MAQRNGELVLEEVRLRGWKSIAAHLGVTQSTAMRWTRDPDFPVLRSGSGGSVYALPTDLDAWLTRREAIGDDGANDGAGDGAGEDPADTLLLPPTAAPVATVPADVGTPPPVRARRRPWLLPGVAALAATLAIGGITLHRQGAERIAAVPPEAARLLLDAHQDMAMRTPAALAHATAGFQAVILRFPDLPGGFTGLAETYLLSCEFASMPRAAAFTGARAAVRTALALAPGDPDAHRVMGFLRYWADPGRDIDRAIPDFDASVAGRTANYLAPLWYGNALIDAGRVEAGVAQLEHAREMAPDSPAVITDYAIAKWQAGDEAGALRRLDEVGRRFPEHSAAPGFAALFQLSRGDVPAYLRDAERWAALIADPGLTARIARERAAWIAGGDKAALRTLAAAEPVTSPFWYGQLLPSAIAASWLGDRERLIEVLRDPRIPGENWRPLRFPARAFRRWRADPVVAPLLARALNGPATTLWPGEDAKP